MKTLDYQWIEEKYEPRKKVMILKPLVEYAQELLKTLEFLQNQPNDVKFSWDTVVGVIKARILLEHAQDLTQEFLRMYPDERVYDEDWHNLTHDILNEAQEDINADKEDQEWQKNHPLPE